MTDYMAFWWAYVKVGAIVFLFAAVAFGIVYMISKARERREKKRVDDELRELYRKVREE